MASVASNAARCNGRRSLTVPSDLPPRVGDRCFPGESRDVQRAFCASTGISASAVGQAVARRPCSDVVGETVVETSKPHKPLGNIDHCNRV